MAEKKEGFFKRLFRFGKKKREDDIVEDQPLVDQEQQQREADNAALKQRELEAQELQEQRERDAAFQQAEADRVKEEEARIQKAEFEAAEQLRQDQAEKERQQAEEKKRLEAEERVKQEEADRAQQENEERLKQEAEEEAHRVAEKKQREEARELERQNLQAERESAAAAEAEARAEAQRLAEAAQQAAGEERQRLAEQQAEADRLAIAQAEAKQLAAEQERLAEEKAETERAIAEETARQAKESAQRLAAEQAAQEAARLVEQEAQDKARMIAEEAERAEQVREAAERAEQEREKAEQLAAEQADREKKAALARAAEEDRKRLVEAERLAAEQADAERAEAEKVDSERLAKEAADKEANVHPQTPTLDEASPSAKEDDPEPSGPTPPAKKSWFSRLKDGLSRSSNQISESITSVFTKRKLDEDTLQELEDILIQADLGVETAMNITDALASQRMGKDVTDEEVRSFMAEEVEKVLEPVAAELELDLDHRPHVILVVGVNGSGKTTTIGKLSQKLFDGGYSTLLVAGDTFRAAAIEQLKIWGDRTQSPVVSRPLGSDAAGLAFDAFEEARTGSHDVMLMDTAGRLQNKKELMDELEKIIRVLKKQDPTAPHTVLLTLDATTGQNALNQVDIFKDVAGVNGLVMTKLDGTARGGIMVAIAAKHKLPVYFIGVGEQVDDLEPFEARDFARSIAGLEG